MCSIIDRILKDLCSYTDNRIIMSDSEIKNPQLKEELEKYLRKTVDLVYPHFAKLKYDSDLESNVLLHQLEKELEKIPEYGIVIKLMNEDQTVSKHLGKMVGTAGMSVRVEAKQFLTYMIRHLCKSYKQSNIFDVELFNRLYHDFESFFHDDEIQLAYVVPISSFKSTLLPIILEGDFIIRAIKDSEKEHIVSDRYGLGMFEHHNTNHVIEYRFSEKKYIDEGDEVDYSKRKRQKDPHKEVTKLISALRLFKPGYFQYAIGITNNALNVPFLGSVITQILRVSGYGGNYTLEQSEIGKFQEFWKNLSGKNFLNFKPNGIAVRRFSSAVEKFDKEDQVIDFLIGFEALFFKQGETAEQTHKISVRVARLLKSDFEERKKMFKEMKDIYKIRSEIVHGDEPSFGGSNFNNLHEVTERAKDLLRESIKIFLDKEIDSKDTHNNFITKLDLE